MHTHADKKQEDKSNGVAGSLPKQQHTGEPVAPITDNRPEVAIQKKLQEGINNSVRIRQLKSSRETGVVQRYIVPVDGYEGPPLDTNELGMGAIKAYMETLINGHNDAGLRKLFDEIQANDAGKMAEIGTHREAYMKPLTTPLNQEDDAYRLSAAVGSPVGMEGAPHPIPQMIHRFWSGGPMTDSAMATLIDSSKKTRGTPWGNTLWYSENFEKGIQQPEPKGIFKIAGKDKDAYKRDQESIRMREQQRNVLRDSGYKVRPIEELVRDGVSTSGITAEELATASGMAASSVRNSNNWNDLKYFSDIARLMYLHAEGGHHMDTDIGLGDMDMSKQYSHNDPDGQVSLLGTLARDSSEAGGGTEVAPRLSNIIAYRDNPYRSGVTLEKYHEDVNKLAERAMTGAGTYNALIASRPGTANIKAALDNVMVNVRDKDKRDQGLVTGMQANKELLGGDRRAEGYAEKLRKGFAYSLPPYLLRLEHLTPDSDQ